MNDAIQQSIQDLMPQLSRQWYEARGGSVETFKAWEEYQLAHRPHRRIEEIGAESHMKAHYQFKIGYELGRAGSILSDPAKTNETTLDAWALGRAALIESQKPKP